MRLGSRVSPSWVAAQFAAEQQPFADVAESGSHTGDVRGPGTVSRLRAGVASIPAEPTPAPPCAERQGVITRVHVVIMGCGRVGSTLAHEPGEAGHTVAIIDQSADAFRRLGPDFTGRTITGMGFDREVLIEAGIEDAEAFAAVSNGDNSNILAARVARETFGIEQRGGPDLRPGPRRGVPAARHPHRRPPCAGPSTR